MKRNEQYYQNILCNTLTGVSQLRIDKSIADFVTFENNEAVVYEIKSDVDNFSRLEKQLINYYKAFNKITVVISHYKLQKLYQLLGKFNLIDVGILTLDNDNLFYKESEPITYTQLLSHEAIFKLLRKYEYSNVLLKHFGSIPESSQVFYFKTCFKEFCEIPILKAQELAFNELRKRMDISM